MINEINSLEGDLYTTQGKKAEIRAKVNDLAEDKKRELDNLVTSYQEKHGNLLDTIDKELNKGEQLTANEIAQIQLRNNELEGEIKGKLYTINNTRDLEFEFQQLAKQAVKDDSLARFMSKNYYLFLDRAKELDTSEMDKQRAIHRISEQADELKKASYSDKDQALYTIRERLGNKTFFVTAVKRNIEQHRDLYVNKYR